MQGVTGIVDDMVTYGSSKEEHDRNLILFLETVRKNGLKLNKEKTSIQEARSFFLWTYMEN